MPWQRGRGQHGRHTTGTLRKKAFYQTYSTEYFITLYVSFFTLCQQALETKLVNDLLGLLDHPDSNRGSARVLIAEALKSLTHSLAHGDEVSAILNKSPVWQQYSQQDHALFIQNDTSLQITHAASGKETFVISVVMRILLSDRTPP